MKYEKLKNNANRFLESVRADKWPQYCFSITNPPTMIASALAVMLSGLTGRLDQLSEKEKKRWADYFNGLQQESGFFADDDIREENLMPGYTKERALFHRSCHVLFALTTLGYKTKYHFNFLSDMLRPAALAKWMHAQNLADYWDASNKMMNLALFFTYEARVYGNKEAENAVHVILDICDENTDPNTGYHDRGQSDLRNAMAGAMHLYPIYFMWGRPPKYADKVIDATLSLQNKDGFFAYETGVCGYDCLEYDATNILVNFSFISDYRREDVRSCLGRLLEALKQTMNPDGGFCTHRKPEEYKGFATPSTLVRVGGSSVWSTYARLVTIAMAAKVVTDHPAGGPWIMGNNFIDIWDGGSGRVKEYANFTRLKVWA